MVTKIVRSSASNTKEEMEGFSACVCMLYECMQARLPLLRAIKLRASKARVMTFSEERDGRTEEGPEVTGIKCGGPIPPFRCGHRGNAVGWVCGVPGGARDPAAI